MTTDSWETVTGNENLLILAPRPGDETRLCGGLIAESCRRGRAPFVVVLTDGSDRSQEDETRAAVRLLGLPAGRLLLAGLYPGTLPAEGPPFDAIVHGISMIMWARDCNVICAPAPAEPAGDRTAAHRIAAAVAARSGVGLLTVTADSGLELDVRDALGAKRAAFAVYGGPGPSGGSEHFVRGGGAA